MVEYIQILLFITLVFTSMHNGVKYEYNLERASQVYD